MYIYIYICYIAAPFCLCVGGTSLQRPTLINSITSFLGVHIRAYFCFDRRLPFSVCLYLSAFLSTCLSLSVFLCSSFCLSPSLSLSCSVHTFPPCLCVTSRLWLQVWGGGACYCVSVVQREAVWGESPSLTCSIIRGWDSPAHLSFGLPEMFRTHLCLHVLRSICCPGW